VSRSTVWLDPIAREQVQKVAIGPPGRQRRLGVPALISSGIVGGQERVANAEGKARPDRPSTHRRAPVAALEAQAEKIPLVADHEGS
jgi:hypothetical protein